MPTVVTNDGVELAYDDTGTGHAVVLVSGYTAPRASWALQVPALVDAGYRVLNLDRRSHGNSATTGFGQRMSRHGKDLADFLAALSLTDVVLVGASMGASTVWAYADLFGSERLRGVVAVDQTPKMANDESWSYGFYGLTRAGCGTFFDDGVPPTGRGQDAGTSAERFGRLAAAIGGGWGGRDHRAPETLALLRDHACQDWRDVAERLDIPALLVAGRDSQFWPCEHATVTAATNPDADAVILEECGHAANIDQPEAFNAAVTTFLGAL